jgi:GNAT superfamily N-acetyltransferase
MIHLIRTNSDNPDFLALVAQLDAFLAEIDGEEHLFYNKLNKVSNIRHAVVAYEDERPVACGAIREFSETSMEVKRMYTLPDSRGKGIAKIVLNELENWAKELGYAKCILETGKRQPEAIQLYSNSGYKPIPNYGQYANVYNSICYEKELLSSKNSLNT